jgi:hypothetical protein
VVPDFLADIGFMHLLGNMDSVQDAIGRGSARLGWTVTGTDAAGDPWTLRRRDSFASAFDLSFEAAIQIADELFAIGSFRDEGVTVDSIRVGGWLEQALKAYRIKRVLLRQGGAFTPVGEEIEAVPGRVLRFQIVLKSLTGGPDVVSRLRLQLPDRLRFAVVEIAGGPLEQGCEDEFCEGAETFEELLEQLGSKRENDVLSAVLLSGRNLAERAVDTRRLDRFVEGRRTIFVAAPGFSSGEGEGAG